VISMCETEVELRLSDTERACGFEAPMVTGEVGL
jgi:hypothetical protein